MNTKYPVAQRMTRLNPGVRSIKRVRWGVGIVALAGCLLGGGTSLWAGDYSERDSGHPYLHRTDVSIFLGGGGIYFQVPYGPVFVPPHFHFRAYPKYFGRHGHFKRHAPHFKQHRKFHRFKKRGDGHRGFFQGGRLRGKHRH